MKNVEFRITRRITRKSPFLWLLLLSARGIEQKMKEREMNGGEARRELRCSTSRFSTEEWLKPLKYFYMNEIFYIFEQEKYISLLRWYLY